MPMLQAPRAREFSSQVDRSCERAKSESAKREGMSAKVGGVVCIFDSVLTSSKSGSLKRRVETLFFLFLFLLELGLGETVPAERLDPAEWRLAVGERWMVATSLRSWGERRGGEQGSERSGG